MVFKRSFNLYIVAGQSNAHGGYGNSLGYPADENGVDSQIPFFYKSPGYGSSDGEWISMSPQKGMFDTFHFGPEVSFSRRLRLSGRRPAIFKYTKPSSSLSADWKSPGDGGLYDDLCNELSNAISVFGRKMGKCVPSGMVWIQGESDAENDGFASEYQCRQTAIVHHIRKFLKAPALPVVLSVNEDHPWVRERPEVAAAQKEIASQIRNVDFCSMLDLDKMEDSHCTPTGLVDHGDRLFDIFENRFRGRV